MKLSRLAFAVATILAVAPAGFAQDLALTGATVIDGIGSSASPGKTLVVRGGKLSEIRAGGPAPAGVKTIDLAGRYVLPGLIDAHAHILTPDAAKRALLSGVTTARVLGDTYLQGLGTRDLIRRGHSVGPELLVSAGHVRPRLGTPFFVAFPQFGQWLESELREPANVAAVVRAVLDRGADVIKVGASERAGLANTDPRRTELTEDEIRAAVAEAAKDGKSVAAHAHARAGVEAAVRGGVRSIEHGTYADDATLRLMKEKGTYLVPTLAIMSPLGDPRGASADDVALQIRTHHMETAIKAMVKRAKTAGLVIAASTDGSYGDGEDTARVRVQHDMEQLVACGFTPMEAIAAATRNGARVLGIESRTGSIAVGLEADLIVLDRNPLEDFAAVFEPLVVVSNGVVVQNRIY